MNKILFSTFYKLENFILESILFCLIVVLSVVFSFNFGTNDLNFFILWVNNAKELGISKGYEANSIDYPPLATAILLIGATLFENLSEDVAQAVKLTINLFLMITFLLVRLITKNFLLSLFLWASFFISSAALGYIDILFAPPLFLSIYFLIKRKYFFFSIFFTIAIFIKWQPVILVPFIFIFLMKKYINREINLITISQKVALPTILITCILFAIYGFIPILKSLVYASFFHNFLSANALNFNWVITWILKMLYPNNFGFLEEGRVTYITLLDFDYISFFARTIFVVLFLIILIYFWKSENSPISFLLYCSLGYYTYFMFNMGVHENHLFLLIILLVLVYYHTKIFKLYMILVSLLFNLNLYLFYGLYGQPSEVTRVFQGLDLSIVAAFLNFLLYLFFFYSVIRYAYYSNDNSLRKR